MNEGSAGSGNGYSGPTPPKSLTDTLQETFAELTRLFSSASDTGTSVRRSRTNVAAFVRRVGGTAHRNLLILLGGLVGVPVLILVIYWFGEALLAIGVVLLGVWAIVLVTRNGVTVSGRDDRASGSSAAKQARDLRDRKEAYWKGQRRKPWETEEEQDERELGVLSFLSRLNGSEAFLLAIGLSVLALLLVWVLIIAACGDVC